MVLLSRTIWKAAAASSSLLSTEPNARLPRSSRRFPPASRPGPPLASRRPSLGSSRGQSWPLPTARKQRCGSHSSQMCWSSPAGRVSARLLVMLTTGSHQLVGGSHGLTEYRSFNRRRPRSMGGAAPAQQQQHGDRRQRDQHHQPEIVNIGDHRSLPRHLGIDAAMPPGVDRLYGAARYGACANGLSGRSPSTRCECTIWVFSARLATIAQLRARIGRLNRFAILVFALVGNRIGLWMPFPGAGFCNLTLALQPKTKTSLLWRGTESSLHSFLEGTGFELPVPATAVRAEP